MTWSGSTGDASELLPNLLDGGHSVIAGRLAGALRNMGSARIADDIIAAMRAASYDVRESDPFETKPPAILSGRERSPYVNRMRLNWQAMRESVIERFPKAPGLPKDRKAYMKQVEGVYVTDAYHSLSIEGYRVSAALIERVRNQNWNPDQNEEDREHTAMRWQRAATIRPFRRSGAALNKFLKVRIPATLPMPIMAHGTGSFLLLASRLV